MINFDALNLQMIYFVRPFWLFALILLCILFFYQRRGGANSWSHICDKILWNALSGQSGKKRNRWQDSLVFLSLCFMVIALSGPSWSREQTPLYQNQQAQVIVFDLSNAMLGTDLKPDRLHRARYKTLDLLNRLNGSQTGMVAFAGEAYVVSPLTYDTHTIMNLVPSLKPAIMPIQGHNIAAGLLKAANLFQQAGIPKTQAKAIVLITASPVNTSALEVANQLKQQHIRIDILGVGTRSGSPILNRDQELQHDQTGHITVSKLDQSGLEQLANLTGGVFVSFAVNNADLNRIVAQLKESAEQKRSTNQQALIWHDQGRWFLLFALILLLPIFRRNWEPTS